ncbi:pseudouridine synthase [Clostridium rectalis]|uniref:pseudouridine synthase n=1 Tax=Clostridium rectalis TaxID=2040295 RepID=UPI000F644AD0|nr:pseudouridine synthase [Clostridium rectalis]
MEERLQKYMAACGVASRRKCEEIILSGRVKVNGITINELGTKINGDIDEITVDNKNIFIEERKVYIALNKPEGYISTVKDERGRKTLLDLVKVKERIYPIGRLDYDTSGLILLTNDGSIYNKIIHPREEKQKKYIAILKGIPREKELVMFKSGINIGGYVTAPANINILSIKNGNSKVSIFIHEGKNRQIRRMCDKINHPVIELKRTAIGKITLSNLKKGQWRYLNENEINYLYSL